MSLLPWLPRLVTLVVLAAVAESAAGWVASGWVVSSRASRADVVEVYPGNGDSTSAGFLIVLILRKGFG